MIHVRGAGAWWYWTNTAGDGAGAGYWSAAQALAAAHRLTGGKVPALIYPRRA